LNRSDLSDYACDKRFLTPVAASVVAQLAEKVHYRLGGDILKPELPVHIEDMEHFNRVLGANDGRIIVLKFHAKWCGRCKQLEPVFKMISQQNPVALFLTVSNSVTSPH